jgi:hypothetical protein
MLRPTKSFTEVAMTRWLRTALVFLGIGLGGILAVGAQGRVLELRRQKVDEITYFHLRLPLPADLELPSFDTARPFSEGDRRKFARLPRLLPVDGKTRAVHYRYKPAQTDLQFYGQVLSEGKARFRLLYPVGAKPGKEPLPLPELLRSPGMAETMLEVDFGTAKVVPVPKLNPEDLHLSRDDLRSNWAYYQAAHFGGLETQVNDFGFYGFAREATSRKYGVLAPAWVQRQGVDPQQRLYEVTTGAHAISESLQLHRLLHPEEQDRAKRTVDVSRVPGVQAPEAPWQKLMAGKRVEAEPLARLIPSDNYYIQFKDLSKFLEGNELLDQWGTNVLRVFELKSRDYQLRERYEQQLCLKSTVLGKLLGPVVIKGLAVTGSDPYIREGTDLTVIFHTTNPALFLTGVDGFLKEARKQHAGRLREGREEYQKTTIESFVTPLREVSLHRAVLGDFVVYSNSPVGVRRVIDTHQGRRPSLAKSLDFQYMRTVFPPGDKEEHAFVFLSDAFIRQLVGPTSRIKEKRRLEALTSLYMVTYGALFHAWETGKLPVDHKAALAGAGLIGNDVAVPEGKPITWAPKDQLAVSDVYNTIHFATPLIELPLDKITPSEEEQYRRFRDEYNRLWRAYFDPIGLRFTLNDKQVRVQTHIRPVAGSGAYRSLRDQTAARKMQFEPATNGVFEFRLNVGKDQGWLAFQVDESVALRTLVEMLIRWEADPAGDLRSEYDRLFWKLPIGVAWGGIDDPDKQMKDLIDGAGQLASGKPTVRRHKETDITSLPIDGDKYRALWGFLGNGQQDQTPLGTLLDLVPRKEAPAAIHFATIAKTIHISSNQDFIKQRIDQAQAKKKGEEKPASPEVNSLLYLAPGRAREAAGLLLEYEGHSLALLNNELWGCFYQVGVINPGSPERDREAQVRRFLGYLPVSPDGFAFEYDPNAAEVVNRRHGSFRQPRLHMAPADPAAAGWLLSQVKSIRAELRLHDDGLHAVLTIERK